MPRFENTNIAIAYRDEEGELIVQQSWWLRCLDPGIACGGVLDEEKEGLDSLSGRFADADELADRIEELLASAAHAEIVNGETGFCGEIFAYIFDPDDGAYHLHMRYPTGGGFEDSVPYQPDWWRDDDRID